MLVGALAVSFGELLGHLVFIVGHETNWVFRIHPQLVHAHAHI